PKATFLLSCRLLRECWTGRFYHRSCRETMSNVSQWETSAPNNNAAPPDGAPEGMAANTVNDTMREMMAAVARWYQDTNGSLVTGGAGNRSEERRVGKE